MKYHLNNVLLTLASDKNVIKPLYFVDFRQREFVYRPYDDMKRAFTVVRFAINSILVFQ